MASFFTQPPPKLQEYAQVAKDHVPNHGGQHIMQRPRNALDTVHERLGQQLQQGRIGTISMGTLLSGFVKERVSLEALQAAGFGATGHLLDNRRKEAYAALFGLSKPLRTKMLLALREMVKEAALSDPEMWGCVRRYIDTSVDRLWADIIIYEERLANDARNALAGSAIADHAGLAALGVEPLFCSPLWLRAKFLYINLPFDHSIFGQLKNPLFLVCLVLSMMPMFGIRVTFFTVMLACILRGAPADEYQLITFILTFKGTQVISSGAGMSVVAAYKYYMCVHPHQYHSCSMTGPGAKDDLVSGFVDFLGSCVLVWVAFLSLPCSVRSAGLRDLTCEDEEEGAMSDGGRSSAHLSVGTHSDSDVERQRRGSCWYRCCRLCCCRCCLRWDCSRGGRLHGLLLWDLFSFAVSCIFFFLLIYTDVTHLRPDGQPSRPREVKDWEEVEEVFEEDLWTWNFRVSFFFTRTFYAWLSFPFLVFQLPVVNSVLTHTTATGYNRRGFCVPYMLPPLPRKTIAH
mmetsp:Transcript_44995/g.143338  ORF Transcript_44995/g.143338 Transcript_44995/m.143338 type:complete len:515 (-) Transcript_44995:143-1687(-)